MMRSTSIKFIFFFFSPGLLSLTFGRMYNLVIQYGVVPFVLDELFGFKALVQWQEINQFSMKHVIFKLQLSLLEGIQNECRIFAATYLMSRSDDRNVVLE